MNKEGIWDADDSKMFYYCTQCWKWSSAHSCESCSVVFLKPKKLNFLVMKIPGLLTKPAKVQFSVRLTPMRVKQFNHTALLDFPKVTGPNGSNFDLFHSGETEAVGGATSHKI